MIRWLRDLMDRYDQLSLRERIIVLVATILSITLLWDTLLISPLDRERKLRLQQVEGLRAEVSGLEQSVETVVAQSTADPDRENRGTLEKLQKQIAEIDAQLAGATSGLIAPREMSQVLQQMLTRTSRLTLHALRTLPPEAVIAPMAGDTAAAQAALKTGATQIYKHGVELQIDGTYLETLRFLQSLEALPWRFFWDRAEYTVAQHPQGRLKLVIFTLGLQPGWLGV
jgi:MSHA biogenesis protein MshJ